MVERYELADGVAAVDAETTVYAARVPEGPVLVFDGVAAVIWREALANEPTGIAERTADLFGVPVSEVRDAVDDVLAEACDRGVLRRVAP